MNEDSELSSPEHVRLREALSEKIFAAERSISVVRLLVIAANTVIYLLLTDKSGTIPWLAYSVIALASIYGLYVYFLQPYRRYALFLSSYFTSISDATFIILWLYATGGFYSSFYVVLYPAMLSVAFRYTGRETTFAALVYGGTYLILLFGLNQVTGHVQEVVVRITYVFLTACLGHLISKEVLEQTTTKITFKENIKAVEAAEAKFRALAETANDAIISGDQFGAIGYCNPSAEKMFGYSAQEMVGRPLTQFLSNGELGTAEKTLEVVGKKKDGSEFPAELSLADWRSGDQRNFTAAIRNITERKKSERIALELVREQTLRATAQEAEQRAALLAEASRILAGSLDSEVALGHLARLVVPAFADACFVDVVEKDGSVRRVMQPVNKPSGLGLLENLPSDLQPGRNSLAEVLRTGRVVLLTDLSGGPRPNRPGIESAEVASAWSCSLSVPMRGQRILGAITFAMDGSGRRFKPTDITVGEELGHRAAVAVEHSRLYREAEEAIRARDDFLSIASHELKTPLTTLQLQVDVLLRQAQSHNDRLAERIGLARRQVLRLTKLVENLLDVSRISSGRLQMEFEDVDLSQIVAEAVDRTEEARKRAGSSINVSVRGSVIGHWDRMRVDQVVLNLLTNAIKYGEGKPIEVAVERAGDAARLSVRDHGIGIPPEEQARIFERFSRAHSARRYSGFGLGLWIVRQIVHALGGTIGVNSAPDAGSTFFVELPLLQRRPAAKEEPIMFASRDVR